MGGLYRGEGEGEKGEGERGRVDGWGVILFRG